MAKRAYSLRLDEAVMERVKAAAARRKWTPSSLMAEAIEAYVATDERAEPEPYTPGKHRPGDTVLMAGVPVTLTGAEINRDPHDGRPVVTLRIIEKRHQLHVWMLDWDGRHHEDEALTAKAAERLARAWLDDQLGEGAYRLETGGVSDRG